MNFEDPYCYPGTTVLRNRLGITEQRALEEWEAGEWRTVAIANSGSPFCDPQFIDTCVADVLKRLQQDRDLHTTDPAAFARRAACSAKATAERRLTIALHARIRRRRRGPQRHRYHAHRAAFSRVRGESAVSRGIPLSGRAGGERACSLRAAGAAHQVYRRGRR